MSPSLGGGSKKFKKTCETGGGKRVKFIFPDQGMSLFNGIARNISLKRLFLLFMHNIMLTYSVNALFDIQVIQSLTTYSDCSQGKQSYSQDRSR